MIQAMYNGVSGLRAHKTQLDVISNNIANINTVGFKSSSVSFREMLSQTIKGATAPTASGLGGTNSMQIGLGASIGSIDINQGQGSLLPTGRPSDIAIEGNGFVVLGDGKSRFYTREGAFRLDADFNLVSSSGLKVLGWTADPFTALIDNSAPITIASGINIPIGQLAIARQTSSVVYGGNIPSQTPVDSSVGSSVEVYDSLGVAHQVTLTFTKTANAGTWDWEATSPDAEEGSSVGSGTIVFDENGANTVTEGDISLTLASSNGATNPIGVTLQMGQITQKDGPNTVKPASQNGVPFGALDNYTIGQNGIISGVFTNGMTQQIGQLALAQFSNTSGMGKAGNNLFVESPNSGLPQIGVPGSGSLGNISSGFLESSNVDLPTEFANMIVAQRGFQANSRIVTTADEILQELVQLKR